MFYNCYNKKITDGSSCWCSWKSQRSFRKPLVPYHSNGSPNVATNFTKNLWKIVNLRGFKTLKIGINGFWKFVCDCTSDFLYPLNQSGFIFHRSSFTTNFKYPRNYVITKLKNHKVPFRKYWFKFHRLKNLLYW